MEINPADQLAREILAARAAGRSADPSSPWQVYMLLCRDGSLYTGITRDLVRRLAEHNAPTGGARYTRARQPVRLVYAEPAASRAAASRRESQLKRLPAAAKRALAGER